MKKVLIYGAGSIGNHLTKASREMLWDVTVVDTDPAALERMQTNIYPERYGVWDDAIALIHSDQFEAQPGDFDIIMVGTPPVSHLALATEALQLRPKLLHIEKPLCTPEDDLASFEATRLSYPEVMVTVGYDHAVAPSVRAMRSAITKGAIGNVLAIDALTREHWAGIFAVHPWLDGPHDSYLGYWKRGGGALCEHSHALHLGLVMAATSGWSDLVLQNAWSHIYHDIHGAIYDCRSDLVISPTAANGTLRVTQDVITKPSQKQVIVVGEQGQLQLSLSPTLDQLVHYGPDGEELGVIPFKKDRTKDFLALVFHYDALLGGQTSILESPLRLATGLQAMRFIRESFDRQF